MNHHGAEYATLHQEKYLISETEPNEIVRSKTNSQTNPHGRQPMQNLQNASGSDDCSDGRSPGSKAVLPLEFTLSAPAKPEARYKPSGAEPHNLPKNCNPLIG
jgi:hypothetical protein